MIAIRDAAKLLPQVGDIRKERMTTGECVTIIPAQRCVVVEVNSKRLWYRVRYDCGICECFKWPVKVRGGQNATP